jgi:hypothetical protein
MTYLFAEIVLKNKKSTAAAKTLDLQQPFGFSEVIAITSTGFSPLLQS